MAENNLYAELLRNGSFSDGLYAWDVSNPTGGKGPALSVGSEVTDNTISFNSGDEHYYGDSILQTVGTQIGGTYKLSLDAFENNFGHATHSIRVEILDENFNVIESASRHIGDSTYQRVNLEFVATSNASSVRIINTGSTNTVATDLKIDNASLVQIARPVDEPQEPVANQAPIANDDVVDVVLESDEVVGASVNLLLANDYDLNGDAIGIVSATSALGADVILEDRDGNGVADLIGYDPRQSATIQALAEGAQITDTITYTVSDGKGGFDTANVSLRVEGNQENNGPTKPSPDLFQELIANGDFSDGLYAWDVFNPTGGHAPALSVGSEVTDNTISFNSGDEGTYGDSIAQSVNTQVGGAYKLTLDVFENNFGHAKHSARVEILDENFNVIASTSGQLDDGAYETASLEFVATSPVSTVRIINTGSTNTVATDMKVDNVSLVQTALPVEEPVANQAPIANNDVVDVVLKADEVVGDKVDFLLANDYDLNGEQIAVTSVDATSALGAAISLFDTDHDGIYDYIEYDPTGTALAELPEGELINDTVTYYVSDISGATDSATIDLTIVGTYEADMY